MCIAEAEKTCFDKNIRMLSGGGKVVAMTANKEICDGSHYIHGIQTKASCKRWRRGIILRWKDKTLELFEQEWSGFEKQSQCQRGTGIKIKDISDIKNKSPFWEPEDFFTPDCYRS